MRAAPRAGGLICTMARLDLEPGLLALSGVGLRRIGWPGRAFDVRKCLFLDTETTGLSRGVGTVAFLVGVGYVEGDHFVIEQYLMRDYSDEAELIDRLANRMDGFDSVCTFNGRAFDMPLLETRFTMCRMRHRWRAMENLDLLQPARRTWKLRLGSCRLARLEELILGMPRASDLPGSEVPRRYFDFLKCGDESLLTDILEHNRQDIATLATLLVKLCAVYAAPQRLTEKRDLFSVGKALETQGELGSARELYRISAIPAPAGTLSALAGEPIAGMANWRLYLLARRSRDFEGMRAVLEQMLSRGQMPSHVHRELSKLYEHHRKDLRCALRHAQEARALCAPDEVKELERRMARLIRKIEGGGDLR
jgi:uncharacterized protein YprB with RNaseH-like and TPR domain